MLQAEALLKPLPCMVVKEEAPDEEGHWGLTHSSLSLESLIKRHLIKQHPCFCFIIYRVLCLLYTII